MENEKEITFNETQLIMLAAMWRKFDFNEFIQENEWIEDEGSVSWFDEQYTRLGFEVVDYGDEFKEERKNNLVK
jgi:hypothetical protein